MREELEKERAAHFQTKVGAEALVRRIQELSAYQNTL